MKPDLKANPLLSAVILEYDGLQIMFLLYETPEGLIAAARNYHLTVHSKNSAEMPNDIKNAVVKAVSSGTLTKRIIHGTEQWHQST